MENAEGIHARIFDAANALYEEVDRSLFPTVDAVRKRARVNMNDASTCMKEWRRAQTARIAPVTMQVPAAIQSAGNAALAELWSAAVTHANEALRAAQSSWDAERMESETLAQQMASAFEEQAAELESVNAAIEALRADLSTASEVRAELKARLEDALRERDVASNAAKQAEVKAAELERRANDLRQELDQAHHSAVVANEDRAAWRQHIDRETGDLRAKLCKVKIDADYECSQARAALSVAITQVARLEGRLGALTNGQWQPSSA